MTAPIVCGVDRSEESRAAVNLAAALADRLGLPLLLVHVAAWPSVDPQTRRTTIGLDQAMSETRRRHERWLEALASELVTARVQTRVEIGPVADWIVAIAEEHSAPLLVVGCRGVGALRSLALGSVSADLMRRTPCPIVIVPAAAAGMQGDPLAGERIVCGVGARKDAAVARLAARLADALGVRLTLIHVTPVKRSSGARADSADVTGGEPPRVLSDVLGDLEDGQAASHDRRAPRSASGNVDLQVRRGEASEEISALTAGEQAALIVVGSRGRGALRSGLLGSVSWRLATSAACPVMICHNGATSHRPRHLASDVGVFARDERRSVAAHRRSLDE